MRTGVIFRCALEKRSSEVSFILRHGQTSCMKTGKVMVI